MNPSTPTASEGRVLIKDITESFGLRITQAQPLHQRVITIEDVTVAVNVVDVKSAAFGSAVATLNFEITNKGNATQELMLRYWYSDPAKGTSLYEARQSISVESGDSMFKIIDIPFSSAGIYDVIIEAETIDGTIVKTDIKIDVPWLTVYFYILVGIAATAVIISMVFVIFALRSSRFIVGGTK